MLCALLGEHFKNNGWYPFCSFCSLKNAEGWASQAKDSTFEGKKVQMRTVPALLGYLLGLCLYRVEKDASIFLKVIQGGRLN